MICDDVLCDGMCDIYMHVWCTCDVMLCRHDRREMTEVSLNVMVSYIYMLCHGSYDVMWCEMIGGTSIISWSI